MKYYGVFSGEDGRPTAFYNEEIYPPDIVDDVESINKSIPADAIEITEEQWLECINNSGLRRWDGTTIVPCDYLPLPPDPNEGPSLGAKIRDWQFFSMLALSGVITAEEALATSSGALPQLLADAINAAVPDPSARLVATMKVRNTTDFYRRDGMVALVAAYLTNLGTHGVWDDARLDALWDSAGKLA